MEILVAMAIGLIGIVVITQTYIVNENYKRSTVSAGGAQTNGALALYSVERDVRMAGWGFAWSSVFGCNGVQWYYDSLGYSNPPGGPLPVLTPVPVRIVDGGAGPDAITVMYGTTSERLMPATLSKSMAAAGDSMEVDNAQGFSTAPGDLVFVTQGTTCAMVQITGVTGGQLEHLAGVNAPYNPAGGGSLPAFSVNSLLFNMGRPVVNTYAINNGNLEVTSLFTSASSTVVPTYTPAAQQIVSNIVDLQAEYGKDNGINNGTVQAAVYGPDDGAVDGYDNVAPTNEIEWRQVLSVRIGVLARSENYVRPDTAGGPCTATTAANAPTWGNGLAFPALGDLTDTANPARCYGYRVFETVIPLRNMIWRQG
ncbi:MAG TPA: PilW family protein [Burkholderiales bacterium]|nr:PilW family protein [Burkholderiales bacterium]